mgnify:CR=1 FL=1
MKILCTKEEIASLIRWCEYTRLEGECALCPLPCAGDDGDFLVRICQVAVDEEE